MDPKKRYRTGLIETLLCFHCSFLSADMTSCLSLMELMVVRILQNTMSSGWLKKILVLMENFQDETYPTTSIQLALYRQDTFSQVDCKTDVLWCGHIGRCVNTCKWWFHLRDPLLLRKWTEQPDTKEKVKLFILL